VKRLIYNWLPFKIQGKLSQHFVRAGRIGRVLSFSNVCPKAMHILREMFEIVHAAVLIDLLGNISYDVGGD
jgi:hypothetical protein